MVFSDIKNLAYKNGAYDENSYDPSVPAPALGTYVCVTSGHQSMMKTNTGIYAWGFPHGVRGTVVDTITVFPDHAKSSVLGKSSKYIGFKKPQE